MRLRRRDLSLVRKWQRSARLGLDGLWIAISTAPQIYLTCKTAAGCGIQTQMEGYWYIGCRSEDLSSPPIGITILKRPLALFRDGNGHPAAVEDRCLHRGARLAAGAVEMEALHAPITAGGTRPKDPSFISPPCPPHVQSPNIFTSARILVSSRTGSSGST